MILSYNRNRRILKMTGHQMVEFSAALVVLVIGILIPIVDLSVLPLRLMLWQEALNCDVRKLAQSENFSTAKNTLDTDPTLFMRQNRIDGVKLLDTNCLFVISMQTPPYESFTTDRINDIPPKWLPNGIKAPCTYELQISAKVEISPLILLNDVHTSVPGLTSPFTCITTARDHWENSGRNPITTQYFMNE